MEIVVSPLLLGFLGRLVDGWLGTSPVLMIAFGAFGAAGIAAKLWVGYDREMRGHEAQLPGARPRPTAGPGSAEPEGGPA
jgi:hypothetical protein